MKILITGATGFIGRNLIKRLDSLYSDAVLYSCSSETSEEQIEVYTRDCEFVFYFAAIHRPVSNKEFSVINYEKFKRLLLMLEKNQNACPVLYTSSIQATNGSDYGESKLMAEQALKEHGRLMKSKIILYRLTNVFGRWGRPNSHSVVATFCYNIQRELPIKVNDRSHRMEFYYIDDVVDSFIERLSDTEPCHENLMYQLPKALTYPITLGELSDILYYFYNCEGRREIPNLKNEFERKLYETYKSYTKENEK